jgi:rhodanese-related sulfurtransferase
MKKYLLAVLVLGLAAPAFSADVSATAQAVSPTAAPTAKPLYVDYHPPEWAKGWEHISLAQAKKIYKDSKVVFLDARAKVEYDQFHIPGALPFPAGETDKYYAMYEGRIKKAKKLVTYCHGIGCGLSEKAAKALVEKGYKNVAVFFGGEPQWREANLPFESGDAKASKPASAPTPSAEGKSVSPSASSSAQPVSPAAK